MQAVKKALMAAAGTRALIPYLSRRALDRPNERSSHTRVTPRGAGLALIPLVAMAWLALAVLEGDASLAWVAPLAGAHATIVRLGTILYESAA